MTPRLLAVLQRRPREGFLVDMRSKPKTSVDILEERDALHARVLELEATVAKVRAEVEHALRHHPETQFLTLCRIGSVVRQALPRSGDAPESEVPGPPISKVRATASADRVTRHLG